MTFDHTNPIAGLDPAWDASFICGFDLGTERRPRNTITGTLHRRPGKPPEIFVSIVDSLPRSPLGRLLHYSAAGFQFTPHELEHLRDWIEHVLREHLSEA